MLETHREFRDKRMTSRGRRLVMGVALLVCCAPAYAYLDPGTGSALIQGVIAAIAAVGVTLKLYWHRIKKFFMPRSGKKTPPQGESDDS
jgi:hypothetical protein